ncbi:MAG: FAD-dependent oxidoreductase [Acidimicrobiales bacterium]|nr:FAD-dependent oxidoreductase [Acidimicrobiales bacterium]
MDDPDVTVIGAGVAGLVAGMTAARHGLETLVVDQVGVGGQVLNVESIEDYPGLPDGVSGYELGPLLHAQAEAAGAGFRLDTIEAAEAVGDRWLVRGAENEYQTAALVVATGSRARSLGVPGEDALFGRGVSHCATCDGPLYAERDVCVIGGGDSAVQEAVTLSGLSARVTIIFEGQGLTAQQALQAKLAGRANVELRPATRVREIMGDGAVAAVHLDGGPGAGDETLEVAGVFVYVGLEPASSWLGDLVDLDPGGHIETDLMMRTSRPGIFAAGDVRSQSAGQLACAAGDGATAAVAAFRYLQAQRGAPPPAR